ncbi:hypothetical protein QZH41_008947 [Actinostola sp. cb2023]|nr:hypothetical protein QZH41_008947 [Actinostola sp. cb2023]
MASEGESSHEYSSSPNEDEAELSSFFIENEDEQGTEHILPYQDEPLANGDADAEDSSGEEDEDGLTPLVLERRFDKRDPVQSCIENASCITKHPDFEALTNKAVLKQVAPLLKGKRGQSYRQLPGRFENELLRAAAYRWLIRWLCGRLGWDKTRPLPSCIYHYIRTKLPTQCDWLFNSTRKKLVI